MSIKPTPHGTWEVRWRDHEGRHWSRRFKTREAAERCEELARQARAEGRPVPSAIAVRRPLSPVLTPDSRPLLVESETFDPRGQYVYMLWDEEGGAPFYIGRSGNILGRLGQHAVNREKRARLARVTLIRCKSHAEAVEVEQHMIALHRPDMNVLMMPSAG